MTVLDSRRRWLALIVLCLGDLMIVLDTTIVNVALPSIRADLGFSETSLVWVVNAYTLTFGGFMLLGGRLGDIFGHRKLFLIGLVAFTLASLACGLSNSQGMLVAARAAQGIGGAIVSAVALSLIMNLFTDTTERVKAMGFFGFVMAGGGTVGVLLGGILTDALDWHSRAWKRADSLGNLSAIRLLLTSVMVGDFVRGHTAGQRIRYKRIGTRRPGTRREF